MTSIFASWTLGAALLYSAIKNMTLSQLIMGEPGPGQPESIVDKTLGSGGRGNPITSTEPQSASLGTVPKSKAAKVKKGLQQANRMSGKFPYSWGGGHGGNPCQPGGSGENGGPGYDCSGCWSCILFAMGIIRSPMTSGGFAASFPKGPGRYITLYANAEHVFGKFMGRWFGTGHAREAKRGGPAWGNHDDLAGYTVVHPKGW